jgi:excisionase family DNA binding protein
VKVTLTVELNGVPVPVPVELDDVALAAIAAAVPHAAALPASPYMTIPEAADYLRCPRQRIDDLLSQRRLARFKDGARTLVSRAELATYVEGP